jgi:hypothetical protein
LTASLKPWLEQQLACVFAKATIAEDIRYALNHWDGLTRFLDDGRIEAAGARLRSMQGLPPKEKEIRSREGEFLREVVKHEDAPTQPIGAHLKSGTVARERVLARRPRLQHAPASSPARTPGAPLGSARRRS